MPIKQELDASTQLLRTRISGRITLEELREHFAAVHAMHGEKHLEMVDARDVSGLEFGMRDLPKLADYGRELFGGGIAPRAIVVQGVVYFGIARLFASLVTSWVHIAVFDNIEAAEAWLLMTTHVM